MRFTCENGSLLMSFTARYPGDCGFCGEGIQGAECSYADDKTIVHTARCLILYNTGVDPMAATLHRNEKMCSECFTIHAGECP
jgi:hypothetical protein